MPFASKHGVVQPVSEILGEAPFHACPRPKQRVGSSRWLAPAMLVSPGQDDLLLPYTSRYFGRACGGPARVIFDRTHVTPISVTSG